MLDSNNEMNRVATIMSKLPIFSTALFLLWLLASCKAPTQMATACRRITESHISYATLTGTSILHNSPARIAALAFDDDERSIWIAYEGTGESTGQLVQANLATWQIVRSFSLDSLHTGLTRFSGDASLIASMVEVPCTPEGQRTCTKPRVWKTSSGELISAPKAFDAEIHDMDLTEKGDWIVSVVGGALEVTSPTDHSSGIGIVILGDSPEEIVAGAFNKSGDRVAYATYEKNLYVKGWDGQTLTDLFPLSVGPWLFYGGQTQIDNVPLKLAISPGDKWVAVVSNDRLELRDITSRFLPQYRKVNPSKPSNGALEFNPSGSLLATGNTHGFEVYSVPDLRQTFDREGAEASAITFSPDGCLLAWGDVEGAVHIINAPKP